MSFPVFKSGRLRTPVSDPDQVSVRGPGGIKNLWNQTKPSNGYLNNNASTSSRLYVVDVDARSRFMTAILMTIRSMNGIAVAVSGLIVRLAQRCRPRRQVRLMSDFIVPGVMTTPRFGAWRGACAARSKRKRRGWHVVRTQRW